MYYKFIRCFSSNILKNTNSQQVIKLDDNNFQKENIKRLRPFLKFLAIHTIIISGLAYFYKRLEDNKQLLYSVPLNDVQNIIKHIWNVINDSYCYCINNITTLNSTYIKPIIGKHSDINNAKDIQDLLKSLDIDKSEELKRIFFNVVKGSSLIKSGSEVTLLFHSVGRESYVLITGSVKVLDDKIVWRNYWGSKEDSDLIEFTPKEISISFIDSDTKAKLKLKNDIWELDRQ